MLPSVRKHRRRPRFVSKALAWIFAACGLLPFVLVMGLKSQTFRHTVTREVSKEVAKQGIAATFDVNVALWPLAARLEDVRVGSKDSTELAVQVEKLSVKPRLFALLAGKIYIDEVDITSPKIHLVIGDGKIQNLGIDLPKSKPDEPETPWNFPFSLVSMTNAALDLTLEGQRIRASGVDVDVTTDAPAEGTQGMALEAMVHVGEARTVVTNGVVNPPQTWEDGVCELEARVRVEQHHIVARRVSLMGILDALPGVDTPAVCPNDDKDPQRVDVALRHFEVDLPRGDQKLPPKYSGYIAARAPLTLVQRFQSKPETHGWARIEGEISGGGDKVPDVTEGHVEARDLQVDHYRFARALDGVFSVKNGKAAISSAKVKIAEGEVTLRNVEVEPAAKGMPLKLGLKVDGVSFSALMQDLGVAAHPRVNWDLAHIDAPELHGTLDPLHIEGNFVANTKNFALYDRFLAEPGRKRLIGVTDGKVTARLVVHPDGVQFANAHVDMPNGYADGGNVYLYFESFVRVDVKRVHADLRDITPLATVPVAGVLDGEVHIAGKFSSPYVKADASLTDFVLGDMPLGNVTKAHGEFDGRKVELTGVRAQRGSSSYEMQTGLLDFGGPAHVRIEGHMVSQDLSLRDLFSIFRLDADPRFSDLDGRFATTTDLSVIMGGPEDRCDTGKIDVRSQLDGHDVKVFGERFDDAHAEFDFHWYDRLAGMAGAELEGRGAALHKAHKPGMAPVGWLLGSASMRRGGELRATAAMESMPLSLVDFLGRPAHAGGSVSGLFNVSGRYDDFKLDGTIDSTPVRYHRANLGSSRVHMTMTQHGSVEKPVGKSLCGAPIYPPFDPQAYARDVASKGDYTFEGSLFDGQIDLANVSLSREPAAKMKGVVTFKNFDLQKAFRARPASLAASESDAAAENAGEDPVELGGSLSGKLDVKRLSFDDLAHAALSFAPTDVVVTRGKQRIALQPMKDSIDMDSDVVVIPPATFSLTAQNGLKGTLVAKGSVTQVTRSPQWNVTIGLEPLDLGFLVGTVPRLARASGMLAGNMRVLGTLGSPDLAGNITIRDAEFVITGLPGTISDANFDVALGTGEARVVRSSANFGGGTLALTGRISLREDSLFTWDAALAARGVNSQPLDNVRGTFDGDIRVRAEPSASDMRARLPRVSGNVRVRSLDYARPTNIVPDLSGFKTTAPRAQVDTYDPALDTVVFGPDFTITASQPIHVKNNVADVLFQVTEPLELVGTNQRLGMRGALAALPGGRVNAFSNDFAVDRAVLRFDDTTRIAPHIDAVATTEYRRYSTTGAQAAPGAATGGVRAGGLWRISLHVYGDDTQDLKVEMTSDPALSREDIVLLLAVGLTRAELDQAAFSSTAATAAFELLGTATGADRAVKKTITVIDDFRFGSGYSPRTGRSEPQLTVGRRLSEDVRTSLTTGLSEERQLRTVIEWKLSQKVSVQGSYDNLNTLSPSVPNLGADLRFRLEFE